MNTTSDVIYRQVLSCLGEQIFWMRPQGRGMFCLFFSTSCFTGAREASKGYLLTSFLWMGEALSTGQRQLGWKESLALPKRIMKPQTHVNRSDRLKNTLQWLDTIDSHTAQNNRTKQHVFSFSGTGKSGLEGVKVSRVKNTDCTLRSTSLIQRAPWCITYYQVWWMGLDQKKDLVIKWIDTGKEHGFNPHPLLLSVRAILHFVWNHWWFPGRISLSDNKRA